MPLLDLPGGPIEYDWFRADAPSPASGRAPRGTAIVMLHEGLGSVSMWRDFPLEVARATGRDVAAYSRHGYGRSAPARAPRPVDFMHDEALVVLPQVLDALRIESPVLLGHSDGASIAIIHAGGSDRGVSGLVLIAPHVMVEEVTVASIAAARGAFAKGDLRARLARHHGDVDATFEGWTDVWLRPAFRAWNIEEYLPQVTAPVLAVQGNDDPYGTLAQIDRIVRGAVNVDVEVLMLEGAGHSPHRDRPAEVLAALRAFAARV